MKMNSINLSKLIKDNWSNIAVEDITGIKYDLDSHGRGIDVKINTDIHEFIEIKELIESVDFKGMQVFCNLSKITIEEDRLNTIKFENLDVLCSLSKLKELCIINSKFNDLSSLKDLLALEKLNLMRRVHNEVITDIHDIVNLKNLRYLNLGHIDIENYESIQALTELEELELYHSNINQIEVLGKN